MEGGKTSSKKVAAEVEPDPWALGISSRQPSLEVSRLGASSRSDTPNSLDKSLPLSGFLIAKKMKLLGNAILWAHPVIHRFYDCLADRDILRLFPPDVERRTLDSEREQMVLALPGRLWWASHLTFLNPISPSVKGGLLGGWTEKMWRKALREWAPIPGHQQIW